MTERRVTVTIDGEPLAVPEGTILAALLLEHRCAGRRSVHRGERRFALCGMGICFECRATVDGRPHVRTCMVECRDGMEVRADG